MTLHRAIRRLRLKPGDVIILQDPELLHRVMEAGRHAGLKFNVPIITIRNKKDIQCASALAIYETVLRNLNSGASLEMCKTQIRYDIRDLKKELDRG